MANKIKIDNAVLKRLAQAIKWAESLEKLYEDKEFATHNPCTKVHQLVTLLKALKIK